MLFRQRKLSAITPVVSVGILLCLAFSIFSYVSNSLPFKDKLSDLNYELKYLRGDGSVVDQGLSDGPSGVGDIKFAEFKFDLSNFDNREGTGLYITSLHNALKVFADDKEIGEFGVFDAGLPPKKHDILIEVPPNTKKIKIVSSIGNLSQKHLDFIYNSGVGSYDRFKTSEFAKQIFVNYGYFGLFLVFLLIAFGVFLFNLNHASDVSRFLILASATQALMSLYFSRLLHEGSYFVYFSQFCFSIYFISIASTLRLYSHLLDFCEKRVWKYLSWLLFFWGPVTGIVFLTFDSSVAFSFYKISLLACVPIFLVNGFAVNRTLVHGSHVGPLKLAYYVFCVGQVNDIFRVFQFKVFLYNIGPYFYFISILFILVAWAQQLFEQHIKARNSEKQIMMARVARQLSHDIRSPMSALSMVMSDLDGISKDKKILLKQIYRRINHLANELLLQAREVNSQIFTPASILDTTQVVIVNEVINEIVTEKANECVFRKNIKVHFSDDTHNLSFVKLAPFDLKRVMSNLINNSVDASHPGQEIILRLKVQDGIVSIEIQDFGCGMSPETLERLGKEEFTFGKVGLENSGSGIGLQFCNEMIAKWGGNLKFESVVGVGTIVHLILPTVPSPNWFCGELKLSRQSKVVLVDDDESVLEMWKQKFTDVGVNPVLLSPQDPLVAEEIKTATLLIIDYEFKGMIENGLDYVDRYRGKHLQSILASSYYDDVEIQERAEKMGVKLVPKSWSFRIPVVVVDLREADAILIDDDPLVHLVWNSVAKDSEKKIFCYSSYECFLLEKDFFDRRTPVYIDLNLKEQSGVTVGLKMKEEGFDQLRLATGDRLFSPDEGVFLSVIGKEPPWST